MLSILYNNSGYSVLLIEFIIEESFFLLALAQVGNPVDYILHKACRDCYPNFDRSFTAGDVYKIRTQLTYHRHFITNRDFGAYRFNVPAPSHSSVHRIMSGIESATLDVLSLWHHLICRKIYRAVFPKVWYAYPQGYRKFGGVSVALEFDRDTDCTVF